jgi:hypothetical protein
LIYTAAGAVKCNVHNRPPNSDVLVDLNGGAGTVNDPLDVAAEVVHPGATIPLLLAMGDLVFARLASLSPGLPISGRVTIRV